MNRVGGEIAAIFATTTFAFHYSADVPIRWAAATGDILVLVSLFLAVWAAHRRRIWLVGAIVLLGLMCKITAALILPILVVLFWSDIKRTVPAFVAVLVYGVVLHFIPHTSPLVLSASGFAVVFPKFLRVLT
jgi:hypothetical protein